MPIHPREVFAGAITDRATAVILAHNHPSHDLTPSPADRAAPRDIKAAGETLGLRLLDHLVFNEKARYSFLEHDEL